MKFSLAVLASAFAFTDAKRVKENLMKVPDQIAADSQIGQHLLSKARKLEQDEEIDFTWVKDYSLKFQGCHHITQWNDEENGGEEDVRIMTKRLVRFRLCPTNVCSAVDAGGCDSGYGDYILDMSVFLQAYWEQLQDVHEAKCEYTADYECGCAENDQEEFCRYDCFVEKGLDYCIEENPYNDDEDERFEIQEFLECAQFDFPDNNRRKLEEDAGYFIGPYCSKQGGSIYLGLFTDETCTTFADDYGGKQLYEANMGTSLPFSSSSVIEESCLDCKELNEDDDANQDEDEVNEACEMIYSNAGKCESYMGIQNPNENACNYMEGIKIIRKDGTFVKQETKANKTASIFIGVFVVSFVLLGAYVYYLQTKLERAKINLNE